MGIAKGDYMYRVFARKYRPTRLSEVVGQNVAVRILRNAILTGRIHHAILFSGPMGVGKTSLARIVAKSLNCEKGITPEPCNSCESCVSISEGRNVDVLEIDGASNRRVEDARAIIESVKYPPLKSRYKIFIIDEVHMLTLEAFNALLKTIEEPPEFVKFIFATTAAEKIPETILSRCQIISLKRISPEVIKEKLKEIALKENIKVEDEALEMMAFASSGSLRVAEGFLDRCFVYAPEGITSSDAAKVIGAATSSVVEGYFKSIFSRNLNDAISIIGELFNEDIDFDIFGRQCLEFLTKKDESGLPIEIHTALLNIYYNALVEVKKKIDPLSVFSVATHKAIAAMDLERVEKVIEKLTELSGSSGGFIAGSSENRPASKEKPVKTGDDLGKPPEDSGDRELEMVLEMFEGKIISVDRVK